jgi:acetyl esterase/lipase
MDVHVDFEADADTLFVFFGGIAGGMGMPPFEFMRIMESIRAKKLFLRDLAQAWYQSGLPSIGPRLVDVTGYLRQTIESADCRNVVFMGNSMGGFAAILFGASLKVTAVHAFSPQTSITRRYRLQQWDRRWRSQIHRAYSCAPKAELCLDVSPIVEHAKGRTPIHIYFGETNRLDRAHATRMAKLPGVRLHAYAEGGHQLVRHLRDSGELASILHHAL